MDDGDRKKSPMLGTRMPLLHARPKQVRTRAFLDCVAYSSSRRLSNLRRPSEHARVERPMSMSKQTIKPSGPLNTMESLFKSRV